MSDASKSNYPKWFQQFKDGDDDALLMILESERPSLFDYILIMTGQAERSRATVDEVGQVVGAEAERFDSEKELLAKLYVTARNFCGDIWNGDVKELQNAALAAGEEGGNERDQSLDRAFKSLPGPDREILCLNCRVHFSVGELAKMFKVDAVLVENRLKETLEELSKKSNLDLADTAAALGTLPLHNILPDDSRHATVALSEMMGKLDESKKGLSSWRRYLLILVILCGGGFAAWKFLPALLK